MNCSENYRLQSKHRNARSFILIYIEFYDWIIYLIFFTANLAIVACGTVLAWTSPIFPKLLQDPAALDNPLGQPTTEEENSWIAGFLSLGAIFGSFVGGYLGEKWA